MEQVIASEIQPNGLDAFVIENIDRLSHSLNLSEAILYYGFPVFRDYDGNAVKSKFLILSKCHGIVLLQTTDADDLKFNDDSLSQAYSFIESALKKSKILRVNKKKLAVEVNGYLFGLGIEDSEEEDLESEVFSTFDSLSSEFEDIELDGEIDEEVFREARAIIEGSKALSNQVKRDIVSEDGNNKSNIIRELEREITNFDIDQRKIAVNLINGPQRIRGLAGSGKTVVLAMKAAHIHLTYPNRKILFTFYTKSLYDLIKDSISRFYRHFSSEEPNWDNIDILHAWGGKTIDGVYYNACMDNSINVMSFMAAKKVNPQDPFQLVCEHASRKPIMAKYDHILIDEAQDLPNEFFHICYALAKGEAGNEKNIVWAYDDLQSIFNVYQRTPAQLFGNDEDGHSRIDLQKFQEGLTHGQVNDLVLYKCYRNPLEVLITAHSLGFGIYAKRQVQTLENEKHWKDVGYYSGEGQDFRVGHQVTVTRRQENSPLSIYKYQAPEDIIVCHSADSIESECEWICGMIVDSLSQGLNPQDILVICLDDIYARKYFSTISMLLSKQNIRSNNLLVSTSSAPSFKLNEMVTLSTVHRAKGNEAAEVYVAGIDAIYTQHKQRSGRNKLFTAFTRTKAWLKISGLGNKAEFFFKEIEQSIENSPSLIFEVPDVEEIETIQRDLEEGVSSKNEAESVVQELLDFGVSREEITKRFKKFKEDD